jgi:hypothetical protein
MKKYSGIVANNILIKALGKRVDHGLEERAMPHTIPTTLSILTGAKRKSDNYSNGIVIMEDYA